MAKGWCISILLVVGVSIPASRCQGEEDLDPPVEAIATEPRNVGDAIGSPTDATDHSVHLSELNESPSNESPLSGTTSLDSSQWAGWEKWIARDQVANNLRVVIAMGTMSLAPALFLMTTCYVRLTIVLSLLRQALGNAQVPSNQVVTTLALFLTCLIMSPTWKRVHSDAIVPYSDPKSGMTADEAWRAGIAPIREFMSRQIVAAKNQDDVRLFLKYVPSQSPPPRTFAEVPLEALLPAYLVSELKVAFLIGFQVFLPFIVIDLVVSSVTMSMGMVMLPPTTVSLPLKLLLFVLVDGWHLVVEILLESVRLGI